MDSFKKGWFSELPNKMWPGQCMSLEVEKVLHKGKSKFQDVFVCETKTYGRMLCLDNVIQITERDECAYQEMLTHVPLFSHPNPKKALLIGGGDGGALREILKHEEIEEIHFCEIDERVIEVSKKYLPKISKGSFDNKRVKTFIQDGFVFLKEHRNEYDVIIVDSSDPIGPAESLYTEEFYGLCFDALTKNGIICCQGECFWLHLKNIKDWIEFLKKKFMGVHYFITVIPTYGGTIGFLLGFKGNKGTKSALREGKKIENQLKYYTKDIHASSFILPKFVEDSLKE